MQKHNLTTCIRFDDRRDRDELQAEEHKRSKEKRPTLAEEIIFQIFKAKDEATTQTVEMSGDTYKITIRKK